MCFCALPGKAVPEMTYTVLGGTLNPTHSLTHSLLIWHITGVVQEIVLVEWAMLSPFILLLLMMTCYECTAVHTMLELKMTGNCLKGSRPLLSFDTVSFTSILSSNQPNKARLLSIPSLYSTISLCFSDLNEISYEVKRSMSTGMISDWSNFLKSLPFKMTADKWQLIIADGIWICLHWIFNV